MLPVIMALLAAIAPPEGEKTWPGKICAHDPGRNILVGMDSYYTEGAAKVWAIRGDKLILVNRARLLAARGKPFFIDNEPVTVNGVTYTKYGLPRVLTAAELEPTPFGFKDGVPVYLVRGSPANDVVYMLVEPIGCEFQPYFAKP